MFNDRAANIVTVAEHIRDYTNSSVEYFYWSPDALKILTKQAHVIRKWLEAFPHYQVDWLKDNVTPTKFRIGITDFAQAALGDIVYIQLPKAEAAVSANSVCGEVESTKSVSEIYAPISGKVIAINSKLDSNPETINSDPYGDGWIAEIEISGDNLSETLLSAQEYQDLTA
jgi:glycine cleavage system H protein